MSAGASIAAGAADTHTGRHRQSPVRKLRRRLSSQSRVVVLRQATEPRTNLWTNPGAALLGNRAYLVLLGRNGSSLPNSSGMPVALNRSVRAFDRSIASSIISGVAVVRGVFMVIDVDGEGDVV